MSAILPGGLNNMIMHMAQRLSEQCFDPESTYLNSGRSIDRSSPNTPHLFSEIFHLNSDLHHKTADCVARLVPINRNWYRRTRYTDALKYLYKNLELTDRLKPFVQVHRTIVHIRTERDWVDIARMCDRPGYCRTIQDIATKVNDANAVVAIATRNTHRKYLRRIRHHFPGGLLKVQENLTYTENAAIHMFSAVHAHTFWGNAFSTFTRGVATIRSFRNLRSLAYNCNTTSPNIDTDIFTHICDSRRKCPLHVDMNRLEDMDIPGHFRGPMSGPRSYFNRVPPHYLGNQIDLHSCTRRVYIDIGARDFTEGMLEMLKIYPSLVHFDEFYSFEADETFSYVPSQDQLVRELVKVNMPFDLAKTFRHRHVFTHAFINKETDNTTHPETIGLFDLVANRLRIQPRDLLIVKMDIEGYEYDTLKHFVENGGNRLLDELMLEIHYNHTRMRSMFNWCRFSNDNYVRNQHWCMHSFKDAIHLFEMLRNSGVYTHFWP